MCACLPLHRWLFIFSSRGHDRQSSDQNLSSRGYHPQSSEQNNRKLISLHNNGKMSVFRVDRTTNMAAIKPIYWNWKQLWKVLSNVSSKQNETWAQPTERLLLLLQNFKYEDLRIDDSENPHQSDEPLIVLSSGIVKFERFDYSLQSVGH